MKITKNKLRQIIKESLEEGHGIGPYGGVDWQTKKPKSYTNRLEEHDASFKEALEFLKNMVLFYGLMEDGVFITDPEKISNRYINPRIKPKEWIKGDISNPEIKYGANWIRLSDVTLADWVRFRKWKPFQLSQRFGRNVRPYKKRNN